MRSTAGGVLLLLAALGGAGGAGAEKSALERDPKGWIDLLPGKDLRGWKRVPIAPFWEPLSRRWRVSRLVSTSLIATMP